VTCIYIVTNLLDKETQSVKRQFAIDVLQTKLIVTNIQAYSLNGDFIYSLMAYLTTILYVRILWWFKYNTYIETVKTTSFLLSRLVSVFIGPSSGDVHITKL
jgi:hypothetical protein